MGLVIVLATLAVVNALWSKTITVTSTVETGNVDAVWSLAGCFEPFGEVEDKDVAQTSAEIDAGDPQILHFRITNGYPSYTGDCQVEYTYIGSVPVKVESITLVPGPNLTNCVVDQSPRTGSFVATCDQLTITWANGLCTQMHHNDFMASSLRVHVEQEAEESTEYTFEVLLKLVQWNESNCP
jgi:hypothetical protein